MLYAFRGDGKLDYVQDTNANRITCAYSGSQLTGLAHLAGQSLTVAYSAAGRIATSPIRSADKPPLPTTAQVSICCPS